MGRPRNFDREAALDQALEVFWSRGFDGASISELESAMGLGRQSIYNAFGDKRQLYLQALERYSERAREVQTEPHPRGLAGLRSYLADSVAFLTSGEKRRGCFLSRSALEQAGSPDVTARCSKNDEHLRARLRILLREAQEDGELREGLDLDVAARLIGTHIHGFSTAAAGGARAEDLLSEAHLLLEGLSN